MLRRVVQWSAIMPSTFSTASRSITTTSTLLNPVHDKPTLNGSLDQFFPTMGVIDGKKVKRTTQVVGGDWKAWMLRNKSTDDLHKLWFVLLKERNSLLTEQAECHSKNMVFPNPFRKSKVRKSMARIKLVLHERSQIYKHNQEKLAPKVDDE